MSCEYLCSSPGDLVVIYVVEMSTEVEFNYPQGVPNDLLEITIFQFLLMPDDLLFILHVLLKS